MKLRTLPHGTAFEHQFAVTLRGEIKGQPFGWGCEEHEQKHLEAKLREAVRDAVATYYQCQLLGTSLEVTFPHPATP